MAITLGADRAQREKMVKEATARANKERAARNTVLEADRKATLQNMVKVRFLRDTGYHPANEITDVPQDMAYRLLANRQVELVPDEDGKTPLLGNPARITKLPDDKLEKMVPQGTPERMRKR
jgi:hypothetical protein